MQLLQHGVGRCENNEEWDVQAIYENSDRGIQAQRTVMRKQASGICENAEEGAIIAVECWNQGGAAHSFFLCELKKHPQGELVEKTPSQAGKKSKRTNNGEQSQPVAKNLLKTTRCMQHSSISRTPWQVAASRTAFF